MLITRTRDLELVRRIVTHASQARMASEDATDLAAFQPHDDERVVYLCVTRWSERTGRNEVPGIFTFIPRNAVCYEVHAALLPELWGPATRTLLAGAFAWMFTVGHARRIIAEIPSYNRLAIRLGRDAGMSEYGRNAASFERGGALHDTVLLGVSKGNLCPLS